MYCGTWLVRTCTSVFWKIPNKVKWTKRICQIINTPPTPIPIPLPENFIKKSVETKIINEILNYLFVLKYLFRFQFPSFCIRGSLIWSPLSQEKNYLHVWWKFRSGKLTWYNYMSDQICWCEILFCFYTGRACLLPIVGHSLSTGNVWRLNSTSLRFPLNGPLPYDKVCHVVHQSAISPQWAPSLRQGMSCGGLTPPVRVFPSMGPFTTRYIMWFTSLKFPLNWPLPYGKVLHVDVKFHQSWDFPSVGAFFTPMSYGGLAPLVWYFPLMGPFFQVTLGLFA